MRQQISAYITSLLDKSFLLISMDESPKNINQVLTKKWSKRGVPFPVEKDVHPQNVSLIMSIWN